MTNKKGDVDILLVEDNSTDAELCIHTLRKHDFADKLAWVKDGAEALDFIYARGQYADRSGHPSPRVILLDLRLPKVDGAEVLKRLKSDEATRTIPIVVLTSSKEDRDITESYRLGVNSYISKPVTFEEFADTVARLGVYWLLTNRPMRND